jgi:hypothetical protein
MAVKNRLELADRAHFDDLTKLMEGVANFDFYDLKQRCAGRSSSRRGGQQRVCTVWAQWGAAPFRARAQQGRLRRPPCRGQMRCQWEWVARPAVVLQLGYADRDSVLLRAALCAVLWCAVLR